MRRPTEEQKVFTDVLTVSSAAGATSQSYSMSDADRIDFIVGMGTAAAATGALPTLNIIQSGDIGLATNTTVAGATGTLGPSTANLAERAKQITITITTATTGAETITLMGNTITQSTAGASTITTALTFGSSLGATAAGGLDGRANSLSSVINAAAAFDGITAATISTAAVRLIMDDTSTFSSGLTAATTGANIVPAYERAQSIISVMAENLNSTSQYVALQVSSATTTVQVAVTAIKDGVRYKVPTNITVSNVKTT